MGFSKCKSLLSTLSPSDGQQKLWVLTSISCAIVHVWKMILETRCPSEGVLMAGWERVAGGEA